MKAKTHSILTVVNATADVERSVLERSDSDDPLQIQSNSMEHLPAVLPNRIADFYRDRKDRVQQKTNSVSWGILFGSEYIWAPEIGPILIVCPTNTINQTKKQRVESSSSTLCNCCILQFENQLSARSSLRIFHSQ